MTNSANELKIAITHFMIPLVIEDWCDENCLGGWRLKRTNKVIDLLFDDDSDAVLFELSRLRRFILK